MGLDMYAMTTHEKPSAPVDFEAGESLALHYWRKHPNLHGWMESLYRAKVVSARFYADHVLSTAMGLARSVVNGGASALDLDEVLF